MSSTPAGVKKRVGNMRAAAKTKIATYKGLIVDMGYGAEAFYTGRIVEHPERSEVIRFLPELQCIFAGHLFYRRNMMYGPRSKRSCPGCANDIGSEVLTRFGQLALDYGLTLDEYRSKLRDQNYRCAVSGVPRLRKNLGLDHNPEYKKNDKRGHRGFVTHGVNQLIAEVESHSKMLPEYLDSSIYRPIVKYLDKWGWAKK